MRTQFFIQSNSYKSFANAWQRDAFIVFHNNPSRFLVSWNKELAKHLQVADSTLSYWEMGKYEPDFESLKALSRFFLVPIDYIIGEDISQREVAGAGMSYAGNMESLSSNVAASVREPQTTYEVRVPQDMFAREEFEDLTQEEIDKLAEYAQFIKSLRESSTWHNNKI